jgi:conjugative transfer signal peptidase TraF
VGDRLRRIAAERGKRRRRLKIFALGAFAAAPAAVTAIASPPAVFVWNVSASAPIGLYRVEHGAPAGRGDMVIAWAPRAARLLAAKRNYLPASVPLVKPVAAVAGDRVCANARSILINGRTVATRSPADPSGRPMPWWTGCHLLGRGELFLLSNHVPAAFDGRYFGITPRELVIGRARLLWPR